MNYTIKKSNVIYEGKVFDLKVDEIEYETGSKGIREVALHPGGAVALPLTNEGKIVMVEQFRYPFQKKLLELPAGKLDKGENPLECAVRELEEETGYKPTSVDKLGEIYTAPGYCTEILHLYLMQDLKEGIHNREEGELEMVVYELMLDEIEKKIKEGEIVDSKTICGIYFLRNKIQQKQ
jgi:ADP-ribose pyrophosphatase